MELYMCIMIVLLTQYPSNTNTKCTPKETNGPQFSPAMIKSLPIIQGRTRRLFCCLYGVTKMEWTFRRNPEKKSSIIYDVEGKYKLSNDNRILTIKNPIYGNDTGYYRCKGWDDIGRSLSGQSYGQVVKRSKKTLKIIRKSDTNTRIFRPLSTHTLFCVVSIQDLSNPSFMWNRVIQKKTFPIVKRKMFMKGRRKDQLIDNYRGFSEIKILMEKNGFVLCNFSLTLYSLRHFHEGSYECKIEEKTKKATENFHIYFRKLDEKPLMLLISMIVFYIANFLMVYIFKNDIKIIIKRILRKLLFSKCSSKKYNFFFIYNFDDYGKIRIMQNVVTNLEAEGFSAYFYHRDQIYGKDTLEDLKESLAQSDMAVIWTSVSFFDNPTCNFLLQMLFKNFSHTKRVYLLNGENKLIKEHCKSKAMLTDLSSCLTSKTFILDPSNTFQSSESNIFNNWSNYRTKTWLISSLPIKYEKNRKMIHV